MAAENIKAMLAHKYNPDKADYPAYIQPKLDGVRCVFTKDGAYSRTGKEFKNVDHIKKALKNKHSCFIEILCKIGHRENISRPKENMSFLKRKFMKNLK